MKKSVVFFTVLCIMVFTGIQAFAAQNSAHGSVSLEYENAEAICVCTYVGNNSSDCLSATLSLYHGGLLLQSWTKTGTGYVSISETYSVQSGQTYRLSMECSVNGNTQPTLSKTKTCP